MQVKKCYHIKAVVIYYVPFLATTKNSLAHKFHARKYLSNLYVVFNVKRKYWVLELIVLLYECFLVLL